MYTFCFLVFCLSVSEPLRSTNKYASFPRHASHCCNQSHFDPGLFDCSDDVNEMKPKQLSASSPKDNWQSKNSTTNSPYVNNVRSPCPIITPMLIAGVTADETSQSEITVKCSQKHDSLSTVRQNSNGFSHPLNVNNKSNCCCGTACCALYID